MIFYVACWPIRYRNVLITPKEHFKYSFPTVKTNNYGWNFKNDSRIIYEIECLDKAEQDLILQSLTMFGGAEIDLQKTIDVLTKTHNIEFESVGGKIKPKEPK